jgi:hypothetical protein
LYPTTSAHDADVPRVFFFHRLFFSPTEASLRCKQSRYVQHQMSSRGLVASPFPVHFPTCPTSGLSKCFIDLTHYRIRCASGARKRYSPRHCADRWQCVVRQLSSKTRPRQSQSQPDHSAGPERRRHDPDPPDIHRRHDCKRQGTPKGNIDTYPKTIGEHSQKAGDFGCATMEETGLNPRTRAAKRRTGISITINNDKKMENGSRTRGRGERRRLDSGKWQRKRVDVEGVQGRADG